MAKVTEYERHGTKWSSSAKTAKKPLQVFGTKGTALCTDVTEAQTRALRQKWDAARESRGRRMSVSGLYGGLNEAILRLPRLTPRSGWHSSLYDALTSAPPVD